MSARTSALAPYAEFTRIGFVNILAFRLRYYAGIFTYLINVTVYYFIWSAVYRARGISSAAQAATSTIGGYDLPQILTYVAVGWVIRSLVLEHDRPGNGVRSDRRKNRHGFHQARLHPMDVDLPRAWRNGFSAGDADRAELHHHRAAISCALRGFVDAIRAFHCRCCRKYSDDGCDQFHDWHVRDSADVHPFFDSREVLVNRIAERPASSDDVFPGDRSENCRVASLPAHRVHSAADLSGQVERHGRSACAGDAVALDCGAAVAGRRVVAHGHAQDHDSRRINR